MTELNEAKLKQHIKAGALAPVYLIYGQEGYLKRHYASQLVKHSNDPGTDRIFQGKETNLDEIHEAYTNVSFMSPYSCVLVRDLELDKLSDADSKKLFELLEQLDESSMLIFYMDLASVGNSAKWKKIKAAIGERGIVARMDERSVSDLARLLSSSAKKRGSLLPGNLANYMITQVGDDMHLLLGELEKLCAYAGNREIRKEDIDKVCTKTLYSKVFDLAKMILKQDYKQSLLLLQNLFNQREEPLMILGALSAAYVDMYRVKSALLAGVSIEQTARDFSYGNRSFRLKQAQRSAQGLSLTQLRKCLDILAKADLDLKGFSSDAKLTLEYTISKLIQTANEDSV